MLQAVPADLASGDTVVAVLDPTAAQAVAVQSPSERLMLSENKLPVVLVVVLIVWAALMLLALRTDRRLARIERQLAERDLTSRDL